MNLSLRIKNYIQRYAPSEKKLREYISRKNHTLDSTKLLSEIGYDESLMCDLWIRTFLALSKGKREMREKLEKKGFPKNLILEKIAASLHEIENWDSYRSDIEMHIDSLLKKGKSKKIILLTYTGKYPYFRDQIIELIESKNDTTGLETAIEKYLSKYDISDFKEKSKFYQALERRGFRSNDVRNFLEKESR